MHFTIYFIILLKTKLKHMMNKIYRKKPIFCFALKTFREDACLISSERQFHDFTPL